MKNAVRFLHDWYEIGTEACKTWNKVNVRWLARCAWACS